MRIVRGPFGTTFVGKHGTCTVRIRPVVLWSLLVIGTLFVYADHRSSSPILDFSETVSDVRNLGEQLRTITGK